MMNRRKSILILNIAICITLSFAFISSSKQLYADTKNIDRVYSTYIKKLKKKDKFRKKIYVATMNVKKGNKVLLVTNHVDKSRTSNSAYIYQYHNNKVRYIGMINTSGTAYPLKKKSKCIVGISTHNIRVLSIKNGKGEEWELSGLAMHNGYPITYERYTLKNNKKSAFSKKELSEKMAIKKLNKWRDKDCKLIKFKKRGSSAPWVGKLH